MNTSQWIDFGISETETALALLYSYMQFKKMLASENDVNLINRNPEFWMLHTGSVQHTLFLYLGRISDDSRGTKSFSGLKNHCIMNVSDFSRDEFLKRKPNILSLNESFLNGKVEPTKEDLAKLFKTSSEHNQFLRGACKKIRSEVFAHAILTEKHEYSHLFEQVSLERIESSLLAFWSISQHLWQCYHNARTIRVEVLEYPEKERIFKNTAEAIRGII
ncbi:MULTISPECIES: hypothetical protein [unclassified Agarivorans]|uniref:AbiU2 domain-containing protein n=1 Tax=unclassified Agarivorans TaxID=2636026 RepID=UPI003D7CF0F9